MPVLVLVMFNSASRTLRQSFFRKSPEAYLVHGVREAVASGRGAPDRWHELRSRERHRSGSLADDGLGPKTAERVIDHSAEILRQVTEAVFPAGECADTKPSQPTSLIRSAREHSLSVGPSRRTACQR
jgi:hypothetical protein